MAEPRPGTAGTILIVDDDPVVRRVLSATLESAGFLTEEASNGPDALTLIRRRRYAAVLLDNNMPDLTGLDVLRRLREDAATNMLPVLLVTADDEVAARVRGLQMGANDYVVKPFHPDELVARVRAHLREQAAWADILERRLAERAAIAGALCRMIPEASAEDTARLVCTQVRLLRDLAGAAVVAFLPEGVTVPLAVEGQVPWRVETGVPLPPHLAKELGSRADDGPWVEQQAGPAACAPFGGDADGPRCLLVLTPSVTGQRGPSADSQLLAAAIDFAAIAEGLLRPALLDEGHHDPRHARLSEILRRRAFTPVFQPIVRLETGEVIGFEALTRFADGCRPDVRFSEAAALERGHQLEAATMAAAVEAAHALPTGCWVSVNVSPGLVVEARTLGETLVGCPNPVVIELTEHDPVDDYRELRDVLDHLRPGVRLSVDDAGSGFSSLRHVLALEPDFVKLDKSWVAGIEADMARQALVAGLGHFTSRTGCQLIAEGVETDLERGALELLDVDLGQGYLFGAPAPVPG